MGFDAQVSRPFFSVAIVSSKLASDFCSLAMCRCIESHFLFAEDWDCSPAGAGGICAKEGSPTVNAISGHANRVLISFISRRVNKKAITRHTLRASAGEGGKREASAASRILE